MSPVSSHDSSSDDPSERATSTAWPLPDGRWAASSDVDCSADGRVRSGMLDGSRLALDEAGILGNRWRCRAAAPSATGGCRTLGSGSTPEAVIMRLGKVLVLGCHLSTRPVIWA